MRLHERHELTVRAQCEFSSMFWDWMNKHDLTFGESLRILSKAIDDMGRFMVRQERHPDDQTKKGDEE